MTFPKLEDWKAPWEKDGAEIDPDKAKGFVYAIKKAAHEAEEKAKADIKERDEALDVYKKAEAEAARANETATEKQAREIAELTEKLNKASNPRETLILEVALEKGLTKKQALRLVGNTKEELEADADEYLTDLGLKAEPDENEGDEDTDVTDISLRRRPAPKRTPLDPAPNTGPDVDVAAAIAKMPRL